MEKTRLIEDLNRPDHIELYRVQNATGSNWTHKFSGDGDWLKRGYFYVWALYFNEFLILNTLQSLIHSYLSLQFVYCTANSKLNNWSLRPR
jgi:hypothetical protein